MGIRAGIGFSSRVNEKDAVADASASALVDAGPAVAVIAYGGVAYDQAKLVASLGEAFPGVPVVGCSTQGVSLRRRSVEADRFLALAVLGGAGVSARAAICDDLRPDPFGAGRDLAHGLGPLGDGHATTLLWYDPLGGANIQATLKGFAAGGCPTLFGGAAGQPWGRMVQTYQYAAGRLLMHGAVALRIDGPELVSDFTHGAESLGLELTVTRAEGNVIYELDGRPALDVWCEQLGVSPDRDVENTSNWALGVLPADGVSYEGFITRAPFGLDADKRTLVLQAPIVTGTRAYVCIRTQNAVFGGALAMADRLAAKLVGKRPVLALSFECGARPAPFLGSELAGQEVSDVQARIGPAVPWLGMYAWGEIAPSGPSTDFHNFTFPLCIFCAD